MVAGRLAILIVDMEEVAEMAEIPLWPDGVSPCHILFQDQGLHRVLELVATAAGAAQAMVVAEEMGADVGPGCSEAARALEGEVWIYRELQRTKEEPEEFGIGT